MNKTELKDIELDAIAAAGAPVAKLNSHIPPYSPPSFPNGIPGLPTNQNDQIDKEIEKAAELMTQRAQSRGQS